MLFWVTWLSLTEAIPDSQLEPIISLFGTIVTVLAKWLYIQPVAIYSLLLCCFQLVTLGHLILTAFYSVHYMLEKYSIALPYKEGNNDKRSSGQWNQSVLHVFIFL